MEAQVVTIDQPFHSAYEKFIAITDHLRTEMAGDKTHRIRNVAGARIFEIDHDRSIACWIAATMLV